LPFEWENIKLYFLLIVVRNAKESQRRKFIERKQKFWWDLIQFVLIYGRFYLIDNFLFIAFYNLFCFIMKIIKFEAKMIDFRKNDRILKLVKYFDHKIWFNAINVFSRYWFGHSAFWTKYLLISSFNRKLLMLLDFLTIF